MWIKGDQMYSFLSGLVFIVFIIIGAVSLVNGYEKTINDSKNENSFFIGLGIFGICFCLGLSLAILIAPK
jgi:hypothetical protein